MATVGTVEYIARIDTSRLAGDAKHVEKTVSDTGKTSDDVAARGTKSWSTFAKVGLGAVASAAIVVGAMITKNIGGAIKRVDTLNNSTRTFENMGFDAIQTSKSMKELEKSIMGLPTSLDAGVRGMTALAATYGDVQLGQKVFTGLNNAILGFGGTSEEVSNAILQLSQLPMDGPLDAQTWLSLRNSGLTPVLVAMAKDMGISVDVMKTKFGEGELTVRDFTNQLIKMDKDGGGGLKSLEKIARDSTSGIQTGFDNMNTAIQRGIAFIIEKIGSREIASTITAFGKGFEDSLKAVGGAFDIAKQAMQTFADILRPLTEYIRNNAQLWEVLRTSLMAIAAIVGVVVLAIGVTLVAVLAAAAFAINVTVGFVELAIQALFAFGDAVAGVIFWFMQLPGVVATAVMDAWSSIARFFGGIGGWFTARFNEAVNGIRNAFGGIGGFFRDVWRQVTGWFTDIGAAVGNAIGNSFKSAINSVLRFVQDRMNGIIDTINSAIEVIDNVTPGSLNRIGRVSIPQLATGGIVSSPTLAMIGEGRESEAVIPLSKLDKMINSGGNGKGGTTINQTNNINTELDMNVVNRNLVWQLGRV